MSRAVYAAIVGDVAVAAAKFTAALFTGSSAMLAEAFHSVVDTGDDVLLLWGQHRSRRPADSDHPLGHGQELYFWSFVVSILIFAVGAGFAMYEGITRILRPGVMESATWNYSVLGIAAVFEAGSLAVGYHQFRSEMRGRSLWRTLHESKNPPVFTVVLEDTAALVGLAIAFLGIWLAHRFHRPEFDGGASVLIGVLLAVVSIVLARESKSLLLGEAMSGEAREEIQRMVQQCDGVVQASRPLTLYFGPEYILVAIDVEFAAGLAGGQLTGTVDRIERSIRQRYPKVQRIFIEAEAISAAGPRAA